MAEKQEQAKPRTFGVVHDQSGERKEVTLDQFETEGLNLQGYRPVSSIAYDAARQEKTGPRPPAPIGAGERRMHLQGASDASMAAMNDPSFVAASKLADGETLAKSFDAKEAEKKAEEAGFAEREEAVRRSTVSLSPEEIALRRNRGRRAMRGEAVVSPEEGERGAKAGAPETKKA